MKKFKSDFLLGAATAGHQVEGNNKNCDCWAMEQMEHTSYEEPSLDAVDHYNLYEQDIKMMKEHRLNAYRFSIEWARIEPSEGVFDENETEHYRKVIQCCLDNGIEPIVTLHHFASPVWLIKKGGWEAESTIQDFARYTEYIIGKLGDKLKYVCTINEANMGLQIAAIAERHTRRIKAMAAQADGSGVQMGINLQKILENQQLVKAENLKVFGTESPNVFQSPRTQQGDLIIIKAHEASRDVIKKLFPDIKVGLTLSLHDYQAADGGEKNAEALWNSEFTHYLPHIKDDDFLGVQNYTRAIVGENGEIPVGEGMEVTQMGYEYYPQGLEHVIRKVAEKFKGDIIVTENGIATSDDTRRVSFIDAATDGVVRCKNDGLSIKGYLYWSLIDNFEWQKAYSMTFGLVACDRKNDHKRIVKPSLKFLGELH